MAKVVLFVTIALAASIHAGPIEPRIVDGHKAELAQFPYMASLNDAKGHRCGGAIIHEEWILTAAHCVDFYKSQSEVWVYVGMNDLDKSERAGDRYNVEKIVIHKGWAIEHVTNDIAMLKLTKKVKETDRIKIIDIAKSEIEGDSEAVISGWGITKYPSNHASNELKYLDVSIVPHTKCVARMWPNPIQNYNICAKPIIKGGACSGDSGSPLVVNNKVAGIASWVIMPCGKNDAPDVYTKVSYYQDWIRNNINTL